MNTSSTAITDELRATLWRTAGPATRDRAQELDAALRALAEGSSGSRARGFERAIPLAHAVAGSAGIFRVTQAARDAREVERVLRACRERGEDVPVAVLRKLVERIGRDLDASLEDAP